MFLITKLGVLIRGKMATILVTGGAGFIGSVAVKTLLSNGYSVVVVDNLSKGKKDLVDSKAKFYELDLVDDLSKVFEENKIDAVIHFAAYKAVEESMENAVKYSSNITGTINLLNRMVEHNVKKIIFSSSAAVYGEEKGVISEDNETNPCNYYGFTKLECEKIIEWYGKVYGIGYVSLRYFNVAGDGGLKYMDPDAKNIFPIIMEVLVGKREKVVVFVPSSMCSRITSLMTLFGENFFGETSDKNWVRLQGEQGDATSGIKGTRPI